MKMPRFGGGKVGQALNKLAQAVEQLTEADLHAGWGILMDKEENGQTTIEVDPAIVTGVADAAEDHPWKPYRGNTEGTVRISVGTVDGRVVPVNWNEEIPLPLNEQAGLAWLSISINEDGRATAAEYQVGTEVPDVEVPTNPKALPATLYYLLFGFKSSKSGVLMKAYQAADKNLKVQVTVAGTYTELHRSAYVVEGD